jgi:tetrahydromethanopterin S-methyltransferase subunit B
MDAGAVTIITTSIVGVCGVITAAVAHGVKQHADATTSDADTVKLATVMDSVIVKAIDPVLHRLDKVENTQTLILHRVNSLESQVSKLDERVAKVEDKLFDHVEQHAAGR